MPSTTVGRGDEAELYLLHHDRLVRAVAWVVNAPAALVEDACQTAWLVMILPVVRSSQHIPPRGRTPQVQSRSRLRRKRAELALRVPIL